MAYTLCDAGGTCKPLRIIVPDVHGNPEVKQAFIPHWWVCDPCNRQDQRYEVTYREEQAQPAHFAWYQIATTDDTAEDIEVKIDFYKRVLAARVAMDDASREYRRLTGCGWSTTPMGGAQ